MNASSESTTITVTLQTPFLYQNRTTGQPSTTPLSTKQLCRILCPVASVSNSTTALISPQTQLLGFDSATNTYDPSGWRCANAIPVLREACCSWYYEEGGVKGPVSTRILAEFIQGDSQIDRHTRVFESNQSDGEWKSIDNLPHLMLAIEALTESAMPTFWPADSTENDEQIDNSANDDGIDETKQQEISQELASFLSSTDHLANQTNQEDDNDEEYESDGGTKYVKDFRTGNWVHEALAPKREKKPNNEQSALPIVTKPTTADGNKKRKRSKPKFSAKNAKCWIYVTGLPSDTNEQEVATYFSKCGVIDLDPETQKPKVKLYRNKSEGRTVKGDASICYARAESVDLALQILDENLFRDGAILSVQRAKFEQNADFDGKAKNGKRVISEAKRKVARLAAMQAVGWDEGENGRIAGGLKGLRIIVLKNMFNPASFVNDVNDEKLRALEQKVHAECEEMGTVEKITIFSKHPSGVVIVKFAQPNAASDAVNRFNGTSFDGGSKKTVEASYWDGVTDYTVKDDEKEAQDAEKRLDEFGDWLENQELPEEFQLRVGEEE
eukprot:scaffold80424_cov70-Cyclotella_meneghiniana.AAC.4